jgi:protocatechuate 3,4-dioxygenase beta subunit
MNGLVAAIVLVLAADAAAQAPARDTPPTRTGTARILGRVLDAENGQALPRALVRLTSGALRDARTVTTDRDGRYEFAGLPAGRYSVSAQKPPFVQMFYGQKRFESLGPGKPIELGERASLAGIDMHLPRGGVITGTVVDEYGEPFAGAFVQPMQLRYMNGQKRLSPSGSSASTADNGEFRLWGLRPGEYAVAANARTIVMSPSDISDDRSGFARTYYPGTADAERAQSVRIEAGKVVASLVITLVPVRTARVSGIAIGADGMALRSGFINAMPRLGNGVLSSGGGAGAVIRPDGTFTIGALAPGEWLLQTSGAPTSSGEPASSGAMITVSESDIDGIVLSPVRPATVSGRVIFADATKAGAVPPSAVRLTVVGTDSVPMSAGRLPQPTVKEDFSFVAEVQPGANLIRASVAGPPGRAWSLKAVRYHGTDITDRPITLESGQRLDDVEIELTSLTQVVGGVVADSKGAPAADAAVFVFSQDRDRWFPPTRFVMIVTADRDGRYVVRTLPPGEYHAIALDYLDNNRRVGDTEYLEELTRQARQFRLNEGENKTLDLKLVLSP